MVLRDIHNCKRKKAVYFSILMSSFVAILIMYLYGGNILLPIKIMENQIMFHIYLISSLYAITISLIHRRNTRQFKLWIPIITLFSSWGALVYSCVYLMKILKEGKQDVSCDKP